MAALHEQELRKLEILNRYKSDHQMRLTAKEFRGLYKMDDSVLEYKLRAKFIKKKEIRAAIKIQTTARRFIA